MKARQDELWIIDDKVYVYCSFMSFGMIFRRKCRVGMRFGALKNGWTKIIYGL